jgi:TPR repeat protein
MPKQYSAVLIACTARNVSIGLLALTVASLHYSPAYAQSADLVLCDRLAAEPSDPDKPADNVKGNAVIAQSDIATSIKFCKIAAATSRRALYQLGRAYAANRQMPEAIAAYRNAADKGSTSARVELGVLLGPGQASPRTRPQRASCLSARPNPAIRAASPISRRSAAAQRRIRSRPEPCWRKRPRQIRRKRNISSD